MEYKIGDYVRVRTDLVEDQDYGPLTLLRDMKAYEGTAYRVRERDADCYRLAGNPYFWSAEMLTLAEPKHYRVGDRVLIRSDLEADQSYGGILANPDIAALRGKVVEIAEIEGDFFKYVGDQYYLSFAMVDECLITRSQFEAAAARAKNIDALRKTLWMS